MITDALYKMAKAGVKHTSSPYNKWFTKKISTPPKGK
jgi:hypothetical protein